MSNNSSTYKLQSLFMFDEEDANKPSENEGNTSTGQLRVTEFRTDKPYRLALYVHPSAKRKVNLKNPAILANLSEIRKNRNKENVGNAKQTKRAKQTKSSKEVNVGLFDENPGSVTSRDQKREKSKLTDVENSKNDEPPKKVLKESILYYINVNKKGQKQTSEGDTSLLSKSKQKKMRRSYVKKCKEYCDDEKVVVEPPSDEILKEIEIKKITKSKPKKADKEEEEFEKWAENVNSAFEEIDKFELSVNYDD